MWRPSSAKTGKQLPRSGQTTSSSTPRVGIPWQVTSSASKPSSIIGRVSAQLGGTIELVEVYDVIFSAEHAVAWVKERAVRGGRSLVFDRVNVYRMSDGKIRELWTYDSDPYALDEFWS